MSRFIESAENLLPIRRDGMAHLYDYALLTHHHLTKDDIIRNYDTLDWKDQAYLTIMIVSTALAYLAQRSSSRALNDIGYAAWKIIDQGIVPSIVTSNLLTTADHLGFPLKDTPHVHDERLPVVLLSRVENKMKVINQKAILVVPSAFLPYALIHPIDSLADIAGVSSRLRDIDILPRLQKDDRPPFLSTRAFNERCLASVAEVLLEAKEKERGFCFSAMQKSILAAYPEGISSLAPGIWYQNPQVLPFDTNPQLN